MHPLNKVQGDVDGGAAQAIPLVHVCSALHQDLNPWPDHGLNVIGL